MPNATYQIEYRDKNGAKHTLTGVTDIKKAIGPLEGAGDTGFVVLKELPGGGVAAPTDASNIKANAAMNGKTSEPAGPPNDSTDAEGAGEPGDSPAEDAAEPVEKNTPAAKKSGKVPAGLAAYIKKKAGK